MSAKRGAVHMFEGIFKTEKEREEKKKEILEKLQEFRRKYKTELVKNVLLGATQKIEDGDDPYKVERKIAGFVARIEKMKSEDPDWEKKVNIYITSAPYTKTRSTPEEQKLIDRETRRNLRVQKRNTLGIQWYNEAEPILINLLEEKKNNIDGLTFYTTDSAYHVKVAHKIKVRKDGKFNLESTSTEFGEYWDNAYVQDNSGKGFSAKEIIRGGFPYSIHETISPQSPEKYSPAHKHELIAEIKRKTGIDIRHEIRKRKNSSGLEGRIILFVGASLLLMVSLTFLPLPTGSTITNLNQNSSNVFGAILLILVVISLFLYFKRQDLRLRNPPTSVRG